MSEPMSDERLAEIRQRAERCKFVPDHPGSMFTWQDSAKDVPALLAEVERRKRGGEELGKIVVFLAELVKAAYRMGADDPIGALHMLGNHIAEVHEDEGGMPSDEFNRVYRALEDRRRDLAEVERLRAERDQIRQQLETEAVYEGLLRDERDRLAERARDVDLIRRAISDPGAFVKRERFNDVYESLPAWSARAVIRALDGEDSS